MLKRATIFIEYFARSLWLKVTVGKLKVASVFPVDAMYLTMFKQLVV